MKGKILDEYIVVQKYDKIKKQENSPFQSVVSNNNLGEVLESGDTDFAPGDVVYFLNKYERVNMDNTDVYVMKRENIFKVVSGAQDEQQAE